MTDAPRGALRVALLSHDDHPVARDAAAALRDRGQRPTLLSVHRGPTTRAVEDGVDVVRVRRLPELPLRLRGFAVPLTHAPFELSELLRGGYGVVQAFSPTDAAVALAWRRRSGRPVVFSPAEPLERDRLADRRLRLRMVEAAIEQSDVVTAPTQAARDALWRWLAVEAPLIASGDAGGHVELYHRLIGGER